MTKTIEYACAAALLLAVSQFANAAPPTLELPSSLTVLHGAPLHLPLDGFDADGDDLTFSVNVSDPTFLETFVPTSNRSIQMDVTDYGTMTFELFEQRAPRTTGRIIELAESNFYDGVIFHRVINNFVIQGGDPTGTGRGGSNLPDFDDEYHPDLMHLGTGILSMAKSTDDSNNSQFFVTEGNTTHLDFNHSIFGMLTDGEDVRQAISNVETGPGDRPISPVTIESARVLNDTQNGLLMLKALELTTRSIQVDVTVSDGMDSVMKSIEVLIASDQTQHTPFLRDIPELETNVGQVFTYQLDAVDVDGDAITYQAFARNPDVEISVSDSGLMTLTPPAGYVGELELFARVFQPTSNGTDDQFFSITVVPEPSSLFLLLCLSIGLSLTLRRRRG